MKIFIFPALLLLGATLLGSCKKDAPVYSDVPQIKLESVSPSSVKEYKEAVVFVISYEDGDGDLGEDSPDVKNLFITDNRIGVTYEYRIPQLAPQGAGIIIRGNLSVSIRNTGITDGSSSQTVTYSVHLLDRAGHESNTVTSTAITVTK